ncbi:armadillo-type protein [Phycomyces nitens]|nr:armadillo-type protein [Phycomyces nitens]
MPATTIAHRPQPIQSLIDGVERYNPENVNVLEEYLATQCKNGEYDLMANLAILKLYQFNPSLASTSVIINILAKALTAVPAPDFNLCLYLLSEQASLAAVEKLTDLQQLLEQSRYAKFWETYNKEEYKSLTGAIVGFEAAIRQVIARVVAMSYQVISTSVLSSYLALTGDDLTKFCNEHQWQKKDDVVQIPINEDNEAKAVVVIENIKFEQLTKVIGYSNEM